MNKNREAQTVGGMNMLIQDWHSYCSRPEIHPARVSRYCKERRKNH